ncbi:MAG: acyl-CoA thioesterase-1 [Zhongshania sp.]|jgi:acyl-CoA thioesterase-1
MLQRWLCAVLLNLALLPGFAYANAENPANSILILGDSISAAYGINPEQGWVTLLSKELAKELEVVNASVSGETTSGALARLPALLKEYQPDFLLIELGGNDGLRGYPIQSIRKNLQSLITQGQNAGAKIILLGMKIPPNYGKRYTDGFADNYDQLSSQNGVLLIPFFLEDIATQNSLMQQDGIHPNAKAQPLIVQKLMPQLKALLN